MKHLPDYQKTSLRGLQTEIKVGIADWEQAGGKTQKIIVDIELYRYARHFKGTHISDCMDYTVPYNFVMNEWPKRPHTDLLETLVEELVEACFADKHVDAVKAAISKPHVFNGNAVPTVEFFRHRKKIDKKTKKK